ncbi:CBS domain-containing protein [Polynucleobacter sphagniphilus]|jgi:CBS domain-containing protein|uniref:CBS domain-containing protein n=1 Tax=Polynucleobacter sphagniphilus TaxID=1743169 RepID=A0AA43S6E9_9BURK|nr:CBS domain-containing protein [Polynucleobacter sphagniphilus]MDF9787064.1 CBS domain-containing protein [Polynucleobacter sphagniphilus]MDH6155409.1 CBS domain-containing protein [Polynucleobacter sphagniphilus]MDH6240809.1 CBS domain-containing protein [Polynucleobacter sphagniphilus]MDH6249695.1 CBS domain-containing protein [Polynucleobacter sphagniphilus]MDH6300451.1 CBS domain-containing protein [Polynucleobacter sphagniphilus]
MKVRDILRVKGSTLFTVAPETALQTAVLVMSEHDIGSLVVMEYDKLVGILTFREVISALAKHHGKLDGLQVNSVMNATPLTCNMETEIEEVRRMMLVEHARYLPVIDQKMLMGVISFYDVAKSVVEAQDFENTMLKGYIRDWPEDTTKATT